MSIILSLSHFPDFIYAKNNIIRAQLIIESQLHKRKKMKDSCIFAIYYFYSICAKFPIFSDMIIMLES